MLDARGAISVTERTGYIARIRDLARLIAIEYVASRETLGFPLLAKQKPKPAKKAPLAQNSTKIQSEEKTGFSPRDRLGAAPSDIRPHRLPKSGKGDPPPPRRNTASPLRRSKSIGTPQRLAVLVQGLAKARKKETLRRGPAIASAFDAAGKPTPQGEGFLKSIGARPRHPRLPCAKEK